MSLFKNPSIIAVAVALIFVFTGCAGDKREIEDAVDGFFSAVKSDDLDKLEDYFPTFAGLDQPQQAAYITIFSGFSSWKVEEARIDGENAVALVTASSDGNDLSLHLPLTRHDGRWVIAERTSMRLDVGTVPAK